MATRRRQYSRVVIDMREEIIKIIEENKLIAIIRGEEPNVAVSVAKALCAGGIKLVEVTFNQKEPDAFYKTADAIKQIKDELQDKIRVGAGTVLTTRQVEIAFTAGAEYIISPDTDEKVIKRTVELGMVSLPGAYTASEVKAAHNAGADFVKLFPCTDGAISYLKALKAPLSHIKFLAVGGVNVDNAKDFIKAGAVGVGVGSSLVNKEWIKSGEFDKITSLAKRFVESIKE